MKLSRVLGCQVDRETGSQGLGARTTYRQVHHIIAFIGIREFRYLRVLSLLFSFMESLRLITLS